MANDLTVLQGNVPAHLQNNPAAAERNKQALAGVGSGLSVDRISLKQSRFRLIQGGEETAVLQSNHIDLVVLRVNDGITKTFYDTQWNPNADPEAPACYSDDGVVPSPQADKPQSRTCAECPQNAWGSKINPHTNAEAKACADSKRMSVVPPSDIKRSPFQLAVPAASLKDWGKFVRQLDNLSPSVPYNAIVVRVAFDTNATFPKLEFAPVRYLTTDEFAAAEDRYEEQAVKLTAGLAEAAAELHQSKAPSQPIPGANPAAAQQAVSAQGQANAEKLTQTQPAPEPAQEDAGDWGAAAQAEDHEEAEKAATQKAQEERAAKPKATKPKATPKPKAEPKPEPAQEQDAGDWGGEAEPTPEPQPEKVAEVVQDGGDWGGAAEPAEPAQTAEPKQEKPAAASAGAALDEVFGGDWDD